MSSKKIYNFFLILTFILISINLYAKEIKIISKINNEIITNIDLENQIKYLLITNSNLKDLNKKDLIELSKNSLINEILKKKEIDKFLSINEKSSLGEKLVKQNYMSLGFDNKSDYESFLERKGISLELVKSKLVIEKLWNTLIYEKFKEKFKINENQIKKKIKIYKNQQKKLYEFNVSEPVNEISTIKKLLISQIEKPVRWREIINYMINKNINKFVEIGPGKVLSGLVKRINRNAELIQINDLEDLKKI